MSWEQFFEIWWAWARFCLWVLSICFGVLTFLGLLYIAAYFGDK